MSRFGNMSCESFMEALAAKTSVPGGGGASGMAGALAAGLGGMVCQFTAGKPKYADVDAEIREIMVNAEKLREDLLLAIDKDAEAFEPLSKAYAIPKDAPERDEEMERCLRIAAQAPFDILALSCKAADMLARLAVIGSKIIISDAAVGAALCRAAIEGAAINVKVNTKLMNDRYAADALNHKVDELVEKYVPICQQTYDSVYTKYEG